jgi:RNA polymerase sigma-70 factor, ECF subfamily
MQYPPEDPAHPEADRASHIIQQRRLLDQRFTELYKNIRRLAARVRWNGTNPTLNPTALAHEAYLKLCSDPPDLSAKSYEEVIAIFANAMLQILRDAARRKHAKKREVKELPGPPNVPVDEALIIAEALDSLYRTDPLEARIAQCRFLFGMTVEETASALNISTRKVERLWQEAKVQLTTQFKQQGAGTS